MTIRSRFTRIRRIYHGDRYELAAILLTLSTLAGWLAGVVLRRW
jgi:hypothetical protein